METRKQIPRSPTAILYGSLFLDTLHLSYVKNTMYVPILRAILLVSACAKFRFIGFWPIPSSSSMYFRKGFRSKADTVSKTKPAL